MHFIAAEPLFSVSTHQLKKALQDLKAKGRNLSSARQIVIKKLLRLRKDLRNFMGLPTDHCPLKDLQKDGQKCVNFARIYTESA